MWMVECQRCNEGTHGLLKCVLGVERIQWFKKVGNGLKKCCNSQSYDSLFAYQRIGCSCLTNVITLWNPKRQVGKSSHLGQQNFPWKKVYTTSTHS